MMGYLAPFCDSSRASTAAATGLGLPRIADIATRVPRTSNTRAIGQAPATLLLRLLLRFVIHRE
jgi:hypothetical protein